MVVIDVDEMQARYEFVAVDGESYLIRYGRISSSLANSNDE